MVGNGTENDAHSYPRCLSIFETLNAYIFDTFEHKKEAFSFTFSFISFTPPHSITNMQFLFPNFSLTMYSI